MKVTKFVKRLVSFGLTAFVWVLIIMVIRGGVLLRNPPAGRLVYEKGPNRVYLIHDIDAPTSLRIDRWAARYSGAILDDPNILDHPEVAITGDVASVETQRGPGQATLWYAHSEVLESGEEAVIVRDEPTSLLSLMSRVRVAIFYRS